LGKAPAETRHAAAFERLSNARRSRARVEYDYRNDCEEGALSDRAQNFVDIEAIDYLVSLAICSSTYFQARLFLPVYSLFQMGMLLAVSLAANILLERLERSTRLD
jgi:hypothetical protein